MVELAIEKLKRHKCPGIDQITAELIKAGGRTIHSEARKLICAIWNKEELPEEWKESIIVPVYKKDDKQTVVIKESCHFCQLLITFYPASSVMVCSICRGNYMGSSVWISTQHINY